MSCKSSSSLQQIVSVVQFILWNTGPHHISLDGLELFRNRDDQLVVREDEELPMLLVALDAVQSLGQPIGQRKIDGFVEIELSGSCRK